MGGFIAFRDRAAEGPDPGIGDIVKKHNIVVLEGVAAYFDSSRKEQRTIHAVGDGTFIVDGRRLDRKEMMRSKLPDGL